MVSAATIVGFEEHLTNQSRHYPGRQDMWVAVEWSERAPVWEDRFRQAALGTASEAIRLELFPLSTTRGWVVARAVDPRAVSKSDIEQKVREVVNHVNEQTAEVVQPEVVKRPKRSRWTVRARDVFLALMVGLVRI